MKGFIKRALIFIAIGILILTFIGCSSKSDEATKTSYDKSSPNTDYQDGEMTTDDNKESDFGNETSGLNEKMIYSSRISIETLEFEKTLKDIKEFVTSLGGFVERSSISGIGKSFDEGNKARGYAEITYRLPASQYIIFTDNIYSYGNVISNNESSQNITSQYYDIEGRLKAYRTSEKRLLEILEKAENVKDLLEIERELAVVRANIESMTTQIKAWDNLIDYSAVTITIREVKEITDTSEPDSFTDRLWQTIKKSIQGFVEFLEDMIVVIVYLIPYIVIVGLLVFLVIRLRRKK